MTRTLGKALLSSFARTRPVDVRLKIIFEMVSRGGYPSAISAQSCFILFDKAQEKGGTSKNRGDRDGGGVR